MIKVTIEHCLCKGFWFSHIVFPVVGAIFFQKYFCNCNFSEPAYLESENIILFCFMSWLVSSKGLLGFVSTCCPRPVPRVNQSAPSNTLCPGVPCCLVSFFLYVVPCDFSVSNLGFPLFGSSLLPTSQQPQQVVKNETVEGSLVWVGVLRSLWYEFDLWPTLGEDNGSKREQIWPLQYVSSAES